ncbi:CAP Gly-rich domain-containing protein [Chytriomyces sp. MP71]|nr:CAP Gly-rich domain-containing protein [Chytriomyces sp. MP71]
MATTSHSILFNPTGTFNSSAIVTVFVSSEGVTSERRFDKATTIASLKERLEPITGVPAASMKITLYSKADSPLCTISDDDTKMLGFYPLEDFMRIHVTDTNPHRVKGAFTDVSLVQKFEISDDDYSKRNDSVRAFKQRMKLGRFADGASDAGSSVAMETDNQLEAEKIKIGDRCQVVAEEAGGLAKRGTVKFVGLTKFKPGYWVGIEYDEPLGKHDGSHSGEKYFDAKPKYGAFVRPNKVEVGDFPEEDFDFDEDEM